MNEVAFLPLTELRQALLESLHAGSDTSWASRIVRTWASREGYLNPDGDGLSALGEVAWALAQAHQLSTRKRLLGTTPIAPQRPVYGVTARCRCRWEWKTNEGGQKGQRAAKGAFYAHYEQQGQLALTALLSRHALLS